MLDTPPTISDEDFALIRDADPRVLRNITSALVTRAYLQGQSASIRDDVRRLRDAAAEYERIGQGQLALAAQATSHGFEFRAGLYDRDAGFITSVLLQVANDPTAPQPIDPPRQLADADRTISGTIRALALIDDQIDTIGATTNPSALVVLAGLEGVRADLATELYRACTASPEAAAAAGQEGPTVNADD